MKTSAKLSHSTATILLLFSWASSIAPYPYAITSQYIGAQNNGDEHVLLFQLPNTISPPQVQQQQQSPTHVSLLNGYLQQAELQAGPQQHSSASASSALPSENSFVYQQLQPAELEGQQVSLTIPISTLTHSSNPSGPQALFSSSPVSLLQQTSSASVVGDEGAPSGGGARQQLRTEQPSQQANRLLDYFLSEESAVTPTGSHQGSNSANFRHQEPQEIGQSAQQRQRMANLTATIEQHLRQILQQHQLNQHQQPQPIQLVEAHYATTEPSALAYTTTLVPQYEQQQQQQQQQQEEPQQQQQPQAQLWRDTQPQLREPLSNSSASLLARLASSSPELLLRLRSLLNRAAKQSQQLAANYPLSDGGTVKSLYPTSNVTQQLADLPGVGQHSEQIQEPGALSIISSGLSGGSSGSNGSMLDSFLTSHNLSSHEEIKIPLVVIAMPRIMSLKRNTHAASYPSNRNNNSSSTGAVSTVPSVSSPEALNLIQQTVRSTLANLSHARDYNSEAAAGGNRSSSQLIGLSLGSPNPSLSSTEALMNSTRDARLLAQVYAARDLYEQPPTTSSPPHTMAPYARQFHLPLAPSLVSRFNYAHSQADAPGEQSAYIQQHPTPTTSTIRFPQQQQQQHQNHSQTGERIELRLYPSSATSQQQQHHSLPSHHQLSAPLIETILASQPTNSTSGLLLRQALFNPRPHTTEQSANSGLHISLVDEHAAHQLAAGGQLANQQALLAATSAEDAAGQAPRRQQAQYEILFPDQQLLVQPPPHNHHHLQQVLRFEDQPAQDGRLVHSLSGSQQQHQQRSRRQNRSFRAINSSNGTNFVQDEEPVPLEFIDRPYGARGANLDRVPSTSQQQQQIHLLNRPRQASSLLEESLSRLRPLFRMSPSGRADGRGLNPTRQMLVDSRVPLALTRRESLHNGANGGMGRNPSKMVLMIV